MKKQILNLSVLTNRGILDIGDILPGDYVYNSFDGHPMLVKEIHLLPLGSIYRVNYSDKRIMLYHDSQSIIYDTYHHYKNNTVSINYTSPDLLMTHTNISSHIEQYQIDLSDNSNNIFNLDIIDEYIIGPLLMYGDINDIYVNLPKKLFNNIDEEYIDSSCKYITGAIIYDDKVYFRSSYHTTRLCWYDLLNSAIYANIRKNNSITDILSSYLYTSVSTRSRLVKSIIKTGIYKIDEYSKNVIIHISPNITLTQIFRNIMISLGINAEYVFIINGNLNLLSIKFRNSKEFIYYCMNGYIFETPYSNYKGFTSIKSIIKVSEQRYSYQLLLHGNDRFGCFLTSNMIPIISI